LNVAFPDAAQRVRAFGPWRCAINALQRVTCLALKSLRSGYLTSIWLEDGYDMQSSRAARVDDARVLAQIAWRATKHDGYDDDAIARFMPGSRSILR